MSIQAFSERIEFLVSRTQLYPGKPLVATMIANPRAGGFSRHFVHKRHLAELAELEKRFRNIPVRSEPTRYSLALTERPAHAAEMTHALIAEAKADTAGTEFLIILAGGDGTSLEAMTELILQDGDIRDRFTVLRLPLGTGNDGSDDRDLSVALARLVSPAKLVKERALRVATARKRVWYAFNIASIGLDAYVCEMTNRLKRSLPGDSYKFWVDVASVFYDRTYRLTPTHVDLYTEEGFAAGTIDRTLLLLAMGVSGHRTYGSNKLILPDDNNLCAIDQMPLFRKIAIKDKITAGKHRAFPEVSLFTAARIVVRNANPLPLQFDGESEVLETEDFPVSLELTPPAIRVIRYV